jgi:pyruvate formate lyase activating enzyme
MKIGGLQKVSLIDYPGRISAVFFTQGCNFRCPYCHNPELVDPGRYSETLCEKEVLEFLERRRGKLDAVAISGGEPTLQPDLLSFIGQIRHRDFLVKLDTNGSRPDVLKKLIDAGVVDYFAMDIKGPLEKYPDITKCDINPDAILRSIELIKASGVEYEFRTTVVKSLLHASDLLKVAKMVERSRLFVLQAFVPSKTLDGRFLEEPQVSREELGRMAKGIEKDIYCVRIR